MRLYEKKNRNIRLVDIFSPQLSSGKLVIKFSNNKPTYHVCILRNEEIRLYDIQTTNLVSSLPSHYQTYSEINKTFLRLGKAERIQFSIPDNYALTTQEENFLQLIDHTHNLKDELDNNNIDGSFFNLMIETYHQYALSFIQVALNTLNLNQLKNALAIHWHNINGNALCYTALPDDPITTLFCDIAKFLAPQLNRPAISLLMPTICTESQFNDFPDLKTIDLESILHTHILGKNGDYLIPISLLSQRKMKSDEASDYPVFEIATIDTKKLMSPYYHYDLHGDQAYLNTTTVERLFTYCPETQVIFEAIKQHQAFMNDDENLLGQLMRLTHLLKQNSVTGLGQELEAGKNGFVAISAFFDYYNQLTRTQQSIIPGDVKHIIEKILRYGTEPTRTMDGKIVERATEIDTCIASISSDLFAAISKSKNQDVLSNISVSKQKKGKLLRQLAIQFQQGQIDLNTKIEGGNCCGRDSLNITPKVLALLSLEDQFSIESESELQQFMQLSPDEIAMICEELPHIQYAIVDTIADTENLVFFIFQHADEKIFKLLQAISPALYDNENGILISPEDFGLVLGPFENNKFNMLLSIFIDHIRANLKTMSDLIELEAPLSTHQCLTLYTNLKDILPNLIESIDDFTYLAKKLNETQLTSFYESTKNHLVPLLKYGNDFRKVTHHLNTLQRTDFYQLTKNKIPSLIRRGSDFERLTADLNDIQRNEIFDTIQPKLLWLINDTFEFNSLAKCLNANKQAVLFNSVKDSLASLVNNTLDFYLIMEHLNPAQQFFICQEHHNNIPNLIKQTVMLDSEQTTILNQAVEQYLITLFFTLFPTLSRGSITSIQDLVCATTGASKNRSRLFSTKTHINAALKEVGINNLQQLTPSLLYEKINVYSSEMSNNTTKKEDTRRQRS